MPMEYIGFDQALCDAAYMKFEGGPSIKFQFPPKILSDNRKGDWEEKSVSDSIATANLKSSGFREITLNLTYIVDGGTWTTDVIANICKTLRGYFYRYMQPDKPLDPNALVVRFKLWAFGDSQAVSCRFKSINVKHSETIVAHCSTSNSGIDATVGTSFVARALGTDAQAGAFPLRTDITLDMRIWINNGVQNLTKADDTQRPGWY